MLEHLRGAFGLKWCAVGEDMHPMLGTAPNVATTCQLCHVS
jgi:hypothetical protein